MLEPVLIPTFWALVVLCLDAVAKVGDVVRVADFDGFFGEIFVGDKC